jgi:hypothetical protein
VNQRQLQRIKEEATYIYRTSHNVAYESELQVVLSVVKAFVNEYNRQNPEAQISFKELERVTPQSVDDV